MKKHLPFLFISALLFSGCGQARSYAPAVISSSRLNVSSVPVQSVQNHIDEISSAISSVESEIVSETSSAISSAVNTQESSAVSSEAASSQVSSVVSSVSSAISSTAASSKTTSSQQSTAENTVLSSSSFIASSESPVSSTITNGQDIQVISLTSPIVRGQNASITIQGTPGVEYTINVIYKSGPSTAKGLEPKIAGQDGLVTWSWKISPQTTPGTWNIEITGGGASITVPFIVTE